MEYYIDSGRNRKGPYELISLVRKIRNGSLTPETPIDQGDPTTAKPAQEWPNFAEFFQEKRDEAAFVVEPRAMHKHTLDGTLKSGWIFLQRNHISAMFSGIYVLLVIICATLIYLALPESIRVLGYMISFVIIHFLLSCYLLTVLRMTRGQPFDIPYLSNKIFPCVGSLLVVSLFVTIPSVIGIALLTSSLGPIVSAIGFLIFAIPGLYVLSLYSFAPLLILDQRMPAWNALEASRKGVMRGGMENAAVILSLFLINFIAMLFAVVTLPVTMCGLTEMYDEIFV